VHAGAADHQRWWRVLEAREADEKDEGVVETEMLASTSSIFKYLLYFNSFLY
jgi:hypothetical protein